MSSSFWKYERRQMVNGFMGRDEAFAMLIDQRRCTQSVS